MNRPNISREQQAQKQFGTAGRAAAFHANHVLDHLNSPMQQFIVRQEMVFIETASASGACDCSFRAGTRGFNEALR